MHSTLMAFGAGRSFSLFFVSQKLKGPMLCVSNKISFYWITLAYITPTKFVERKKQTTQQTPEPSEDNNQNKLRVDTSIV